MLRYRLTDCVTVLCTAKNKGSFLVMFTIFRNQSKKANEKNKMVGLYEEPWPLSNTQGYAANCPLTPYPIAKAFK